VAHGAAPTAANLQAIWHAANRAAAERDSAALDQAEQAAWDAFADAANSEGLCYHCLTDLSQWPEWNNVNCPKHCASDTLAEYNEYRNGLGLAVLRKEGS
jgi:hypothetical protein